MEDAEIQGTVVTSLLRVEVDNVGEQTLEALAKVPCPACGESGLVDIWTDEPLVDKEGRFFMDVLGGEELRAFLIARNVTFKVEVPDMEALLEAMDPATGLPEKDVPSSLLESRANSTGPKRAIYENEIRGSSCKHRTYHKEYHALDDIIDRLYALNKQYPDTSEVVSFGKTVQGRKLPSIRIYPNKRERFGGPLLLLQCGIHAREWLAPATCLYVAEELLENQPSMLEIAAVQIIPSGNPDGYAYTWSAPKNMQHRMHRKNIRHVDLNRNYPSAFGACGEADLPEYDDSYAGVKPFSEPESQSVRDYMQFLRSTGWKPAAFIDFHCYGQIILRPYGWSKKDHPQEARTKALSERMASAFLEAGGRTYVSAKGSALYSDVIEMPPGSPTCFSGSIMDWMAEETDLELAYIIEVAPGMDENNGFVAPAALIAPTGEGAYEAVKLVLSHIVGEMGDR